jgi:hypothetical protein
VWKLCGSQSILLSPHIFGFEENIAYFSCENYTLSDNYVHDYTTLLAKQQLIYDPELPSIIIILIFKININVYSNPLLGVANLGYARSCRTSFSYYGRNIKYNIARKRTAETMIVANDNTDNMILRLLIIISLL